MSDPVKPITFRPIGVIHTPFTEVAGMPVQASAAEGAPGRIELEAAFVDGLRDLDTFSHLILLYHLDRTGPPRLIVTPFFDDREHGVFATRSPARPNPIGLSTVRLVSIAGNVLEIADVDILDGTPLLDIKPYVPALDDRPQPRIGWYADRIDRLPGTRADRRFS